MQSLYPCIMSILIFPSKIWAKSEHYTQQNMVLLNIIMAIHVKTSVAILSNTRKDGKDECRY